MGAGDLRCLFCGDSHHRRLPRGSVRSYCNLTHAGYIHFGPRLHLPSPLHRIKMGRMPGDILTCHSRSFLPGLEIKAHQHPSPLASLQARLCADETSHHLGGWWYAQWIIRRAILQRVNFLFSFLFFFPCWCYPLSLPYCLLTGRSLLRKLDEAGAAVYAETADDAPLKASQHYHSGILSSLD